jgi:hypothetical protein
VSVSVVQNSIFRRRVIRPQRPEIDVRTVAGTARFSQSLRKSSPTPIVEHLSIAPIFKRVAQWIGIPARFVAEVSGRSTRVGAAQDNRGARHRLGGHYAGRRMEVGTDAVAVRGENQCRTVRGGAGGGRERARRIGIELRSFNTWRRNVRRIGSRACRSWHDHENSTSPARARLQRRAATLAVSPIIVIARLPGGFRKPKATSRDAGRYRCR